MNAKMQTSQYRLTAPDLEVVLAVVRGGSLAAASSRLGVDVSTVFRSIQRIETGLGQRLFERTRSGYIPLEIAQSLAQHAEHMEVALESARSAAQLAPEDVSGTVRITTTDALLSGLIAPALKQLREMHPLLSFEFNTGSTQLNLSRRDADIAVRVGKRCPQHLVGKHLGQIRLALYTGARGTVSTVEEAMEISAPWIGVDDAMPDHDTVLWRKKRIPKLVPAYRVNNFISMLDMVELGLGVGILPQFLAENRKGLVRLTDALDECDRELWLLTHPEARHLRRVSATFNHLANNIVLNQGIRGSALNPGQ
jgi:DNA-binding transcriptional LysR family regulator